MYPGVRRCGLHHCVAKSSRRTVTLSDAWKRGSALVEPMAGNPSFTASRNGLICELPFVDVPRSQDTLRLLVVGADSHRAEQASPNRKDHPYPACITAWRRGSTVWRIGGRCRFGSHRGSTPRRGSPASPAEPARMEDVPHRVIHSSLPRRCPAAPTRPKQKSYEQAHRQSPRGQH